MFWIFVISLLVQSINFFNQKISIDSRNSAEFLCQQIFRKSFFKLQKTKKRQRLQTRANIPNMIANWEQIKRSYWLNCVRERSLASLFQNTTVSIAIIFLRVNSTKKHGRAFYLHYFDVTQLENMDDFPWIEK